MSSSTDPPAYEFGPFRLDLRSRQLLRDGAPVPLTPKVLDVLAVLVEHGGQLVLKEDLLKAVWPDTFVAEANLTQAVFVLRKALGETGSEQRYITTVPGRGYRFTAELKRVVDESPAATQAPPVDAPAMQPDRAGPRVPRWLALSALAILVLAVLAAYLVFRSAGGRDPAGTKAMLAVLPFSNLTGDPAQEYFSDGLTEEMIAQVGNIDPARLGVIARTSVMRYKERAPQLDSVGRDLGVQYLLEGSVRRDHRRVRITAQLIRVGDQTHIWSRQYDRELSSLLAVQGEIAMEIATEISRTLVDMPTPAPQPGAQTLSPSAYRAYDLYLQGRYFWNKRTPAGFEQAIEHFQQAVALDPGDVRAHAGLADSYALMNTYGLGPSMELVPKARSAALRALELDATRAEAHTALALISMNYDWNWAAAEKAYLRAIELDPNYATAHHWYAELLAFQGRFSEAFAASARARQLDPLSLIIAADYGAIFYYSRQYDRAIEQFRNVLSTEPGFPRARLIAYAYAQKGMFAEALAEAARWRRVDDSPAMRGLEAYILARHDRARDARHAVAAIEAETPRPGFDLTPILAVVYAGLDDRDKAIGALQKAYREHSNILVTLKVDPIFDPLRGDARFQALLRLVGLDSE